MVSDEEQNKLVEVVNGLSIEAFRLVEFEGFGLRISFNFSMNDSPLMVAVTKEHEKGFTELLNVGFVYMDTERDKIGYRSNDRGLLAHYLIKHSRKLNEKDKEKS